MERAFDSATGGVAPTPVGGAMARDYHHLLGLHPVAIYAPADRKLPERPVRHQPAFQGTPGW